MKHSRHVYRAGRINDSKSDHSDDDTKISDDSLSSSKVRRIIPSRKPVKSSLIALPILAVLAIAGLGISKYMNKSQPFIPPLPSNIISGLNFRVYYPSKLPPGYEYQDKSAGTQPGLFYYKLKNGNKTITITQQLAPPSGVDLTALPSYSNLSVPNGKAALGISVGNPSAVIIIDRTIININASKGVTKEAVSGIARDIKPVILQATY